MVQRTQKMLDSGQHKKKPPPLGAKAEKLSRKCVCFKKSANFFRFPLDKALRDGYNSTR